MDQWIFKGGYPELKASFEWDEKNKSRTFKLVQAQETNDLTPIFNFNNHAEFFFADGTCQRQAINMKQKEQIFCVNLKEKPTYLRFDIGNSLIKTLEWNVPLEMSKEQLLKDTDVVGKIWAM